MSMRSRSYDVVAAANAETTQEVITGRTGIRRRISHIWMEQNASMVLRAYVDQDRLVEVGCEVEQADFQPVMVDRELQDGETFIVAWNNETGGALTARIVVFYEED